jgi:putative oxidoreductase
MITAIRKVHARNGPWVAEGGYEYNLVLLAAVFAITDLGPGDWSLDEALGIRLSGPGWAIAQLAAGAIGSSAAVALGERQPAPAPPAASPSMAEPGAGDGGAGTPQTVHDGGQSAQV